MEMVVSHHAKLTDYKNLPCMNFSLCLSTKPSKANHPILVLLKHWKMVSTVIFISINKYLIKTENLQTVPSEAPTSMDAKLLNSSTVYVKWKAPPTRSHNGIIKSYNVIVRGVNIYKNISKVLTNITIDATSSSIMLANLTEGVTYTVSVAAINRIGIGPYNSPAMLRLDPITKRLDTSNTYRFPLNNDRIDDFLTKPWFIILLGTILVIMMLSFGIMVFIKRKHMLMKHSHSAFNGLAGKFSLVFINLIMYALQSAELLLCCLFVSTF